MNADSNDMNSQDFGTRPDLPEEEVTENAMQRAMEKRSRLTEAAIELNMQSFIRDAKSFLYAPERDALPGVAGKTFLHLQCRSGLETLSWNRLGARTVGVDFDEQAIKRASTLAQAANLEAKFLCTDIYRLLDLPAENFDIIYTAYGVLFWLSDLQRWARVIARHLAPQGLFHLVDYHPTANLLDERFDKDNPGSPRICYPHAHTFYRHYSNEFGPPPFEYRDLKIWNYTISDVQQALIDAGLRITSIKEHDYMFIRRFEQMKETRENHWQWSDPSYSIPLLFSLTACH